MGGVSEPLKAGHGNLAESENILAVSKTGMKLDYKP